MIPRNDGLAFDDQFFSAQPFELLYLPLSTCDLLIRDLIGHEIRVWRDPIRCVEK